MKLDLLYEVDVPKPWDGPHPYGQRRSGNEWLCGRESYGIRFIWERYKHHKSQRTGTAFTERILNRSYHILHILHLRTMQASISYVQPTGRTAFSSSFHQG